jgi:nucleotide-binding universal stress UspA family protein
MRILYATDGSEGADCAGKFLNALPHRRDVHVHIVTVLQSSEPNAATDRAAKILAGARETLGGFPGHVTSATTWGHSTSEIVEALLFTATYIKADLIVMGASGLSGLARFFLGSVSEAIARHAGCPVLLARRLNGPLREVVVGVDGSERARNAACWVATTMPLPDDCALHLVRSETPPVWVWDSQPSGLTVLESESELAQAIKDGSISTRAYLEPLARELSGSGRRTITTEVTVGPPAHALVRTARERNAGLIVVGSHGATDIERFLMGGVAENVLRHADCSVLVVRQPPAATTAENT